MFTYELVCNQSMDDRQDVACVLTALGATYELTEHHVDKVWYGELPYYTYTITATKNVDAVQSYCELVDNSDSMR